MSDQKINDMKVIFSNLRRTLSDVSCDIEDFCGLLNDLLDENNEEYNFFVEKFFLKLEGIVPGNSMYCMIDMRDRIYRNNISVGYGNGNIPDKDNLNDA